MATLVCSVPQSHVSAREPKLLDRLADALHRQNYLPALVHDYVDWVRRFIFFHHKQHPSAMGLPEIQGYLNYLAGDGAATLFQRSEAERALNFLYVVVLEKPLRQTLAEEVQKPTAPRLLEQMREILRVRHYSRRTEDCYVDWTRRYILFNQKRHPAAMGATEVTRFLTHLAVEGHVSVSTQRQALNALVFLYHQVLEIQLGRLDHLKATRPERLPRRDFHEIVLGHQDASTRMVPAQLTPPVPCSRSPHP